MRKLLTTVAVALTLAGTLTAVSAQTFQAREPQPQSGSHSTPSLPRGRSGMLRPLAVRAIRASDAKSPQLRYCRVGDGRSVGFLQRLANILVETNCRADFVLPCRQHATGALA